MNAYGMRAAPEFGDEVFCVPMIQRAYKAVGSDIVTARMDFAGPDVTQGIAYHQFFGKLLHALGAETDVNSADTNVDNGAASAVGGWLMVQITGYSGTGSAEISIDDSADGTSWTALSGATSGAIEHTSMPYSAIIQLGTTATVRRYLRWQLALDTLTSVTFALAFMRGI